MLTPAQIEAYVIAAIDRLRQGQSVEDARLEFKREFIDGYKAARRLAGHLNASRGDWALWVLGVDEATGEIHPLKGNHREWYQDLASWFEPPVPSVVRDLMVPYSEGQVLAMLFESDRAPYIVKIKDRESGTATREVPWRENTSVRSANHEDLIRILTPLQRVPQVRVLTGEVRLHPKLSFHGNLFVRLDLYFVPQSEGRIVIPFHQASAEIHMGERPVHYTPTDLSLRPRAKDWLGNVVRSHTILDSSSEVLVDGPGTVQLILWGFVEHDELAMADALSVHLELLPISLDTPLHIRAGLRRKKTSTGPDDSTEWVHVLTAE